MTTPELRYLVTLSIKSEDGDTTWLWEMFHELKRKSLILDDAEYQEWRNGPTAICCYFDATKLEVCLTKYNKALKGRSAIFLSGVTPTMEDGRGTIQAVFYTYPIYDLSAISTLIDWLENNPPPDFR